MKTICAGWHASIKGAAVLQSSRARARSGAVGAPLSRTVPTGGLLFVTVPFSYPHHRDPIDTMYRPSLSRSRPAVRRRASARRPRPRSRGLVSRCGAAAAMDFAASRRAVSGAVSVVREMEALDGAPLLARRRVPDHLRRFRKTISRRPSRPFRGLRPLDGLDHRRAVAFGRPAGGVAPGEIGLARHWRPWRAER